MIHHDSWSFWKPVLGNNLHHGSKTKKKSKNLFYCISRYLDIYRNFDSILESSVILNDISNWCWVDGAIIAFRIHSATLLATLLAYGTIISSSFWKNVWLLVNLLQVIAFVIALSSQIQATDENDEAKTMALVDVNEVTEPTGTVNICRPIDYSLR